MNRLRAIRIDRGLSQFELAEATAGVWRRWKIQLAETGHYSPSQEERQAIASALNVRSERLFPPIEASKLQSKERTNEAE